MKTNSKIATLGVALLFASGANAATGYKLNVPLPIAVSSLADELLPPVPLQGPAQLFAPAALRFGNLYLDDESAKKVMLQVGGDTGSVTLSEAPSFEGESSGFSVDTAKSTCTGTLPAGNSCEVWVTSHAKALGSPSGTLLVRTQEGQALSIAVSSSVKNPLALKATSFPAAKRGKPYEGPSLLGFLSYKGERVSDASAISWTVEGETIPGLQTMSEVGVLTGIAAKEAESLTLEVTASYRGASSTQSYLITVIDSLLGIKAMAPLGLTNCALTTSSEVQCWGSNSYGLLGAGTGTSGFRVQPQTVLGLIGGVKQLASGGNHACAITGNDELHCWGLDNWGQLGRGSSSAEGHPAPAAAIQFPQKIKDVALADASTCALPVTGGVTCVGYQSGGMLGTGAYSPDNNSFVAVAVNGLSGETKKIVGGRYNFCAISAAGALQCWGARTGAGVGPGSEPFVYGPEQVLGLTSGVLEVALGEQAGCAIKSGGLWCWGQNQRGLLGAAEDPSYQPVLAHGRTTGAAHVALERYGRSGCAALTAGGVYCWGQNSSGQLGRGYTGPTEGWGPVLGLETTKVSQLAGGDGFYCAVLADNTAKCWGNNYVYSLLGHQDGSQNVVPEPVGVLD